MRHRYHAAISLALAANPALAQGDQPWFAPRVVPARPAVTIDADGAGRLEIASTDDDGVTLWTLDAGPHPTRSIVFDGAPGDGVEDLAAIRATGGSSASA